MNESLRFPARLAGTFLLCLLLAAAAVLSLCAPALAADQPAPARLTDPASLDMTAPNAKAKTLVDEAMKYAGMTRTQAVAAGLPLYNGNWCASFVGLCAKNAGLGDVIPYNSAWPNEKRMYEDVTAAGGVRVTKPQVGDLVFFDFDEKTGFDLQSLKHIGIVCGIDRSTGEVYVVHGNAHTKDAGGYAGSVVCAVGTKCPYCNRGSWSLRYAPGDPQIAAYVRPDWSGSHVKNGLVMEDNRWFYYENGVMKTGFVDIDGQTYYFDPVDGHRKNDGAIAIGKDKDQLLYFLNKDGTVMKDQWKEHNGKTYYLDPTDGHAVKNCIRTIGGKKYYFDVYGIRKSGLVTLNGKKYYFSPTTFTMVTGHVKTEDGKHRYFSPKDGHMLKGGWIPVNGKNQYYADQNGVLYTGMRKIGTRSYYFAAKDAHMLRSGLVNGPGGQKYYVHKDGHVMKDGWAHGPNNWWYYLDKTGVVIDSVQRATRPTYTPK